jgi:ATP/maltotriose-dependent transcriptional regulator MalT
MAQVFLTRGDLDRALALLEESLQLDEQLGDKKGKAASLGQMANILMAQGEWAEAERVLQDSLQLARAAGSASDVAFAAVKLGQVAEARHDRATALACYRDGLAIFERLGMPEARQVRQMIADLEGGGAPPAPGAAARREQIEALAAQARDAALAALRGEIERGPLAERLADLAAQAADGEEPGSPWDELAGYLRAVAALLRGEPAPPVPAAYAAHLAALRQGV